MKKMNGFSAGKKAKTTKIVMCQIETSTNHVQSCYDSSTCCTRG